MRRLMYTHGFLSRNGIAVAHPRGRRIVLHNRIEEQAVGCLGPGRVPFARTRANGAGMTKDGSGASQRCAHLGDRRRLAAGGADQAGGLLHQRAIAHGRAKRRVLEADAHMTAAAYRLGDQRADVDA